MIKKIIRIIDNHKFVEFIIELFEAVVPQKSNSAFRFIKLNSEDTILEFTDKLIIDKN